MVDVVVQQLGFNAVGNREMHARAGCVHLLEHVQLRVPTRCAGDVQEITLVRQRRKPVRAADAEHVRQFTRGNQRLNRHFVAARVLEGYVELDVRVVRVEHLRPLGDRVRRDVRRDGNV